MAYLALLALLLAVTDRVCAARARRRAGRLMQRPAEDWDAEDVDRWLALIEPFPLGDKTRR